MATFYGHVRSNGQLTKDKRGRSFKNAKEACADAAKSMPKLLEGSLQPDGNTYVTTEVRDKDRTVCVIRGSILQENR